MVICRNCYIPMIGVISFSKNRHERFCRCPKCYSEIRHRRIREDEIDFGEMLYKAFNNNAERI